MRNPVEEYEAAKTRFVSGNRYAIEPELARWGRAAGLSADEIISDVRESDPHGEHDAGIRRMWNSTTFRPHDEQSPYSYRPRTSYAPRTHEHRHPDFVCNLIRDGGGKASSKDLFPLSPVPVSRLSPHDQTAAFLSLYKPSDLLHIFANDQHRRAELGRDILTRDEWLERLRRTGDLGGDCIGRNPLTGRQGTNGEGRPSFTSRDCVNGYRYALVEFDALPLAEQCAFWLGWLHRPNLAPQLAALTFSGSKSIHGLVRTGADAITAPKIEQDLHNLLCSDPDERYRADPNTLKPHGGTRLAGATRRGNGGRMQTLLFLAPKPDAPTAPAEPRETPQTRPTHETGKETARADGRAVEPLRAVYAHCTPVPPTPPPDNAPLDEILAYFDVIESMA